MRYPKSRAIALVIAATALLFVLFCPASPAAELTNDDARRVASESDTPYTLPADSSSVARPLTALDIFLEDLQETNIAYIIVHRVDGTIDLLLLDPIAGDAKVVCAIARRHGDVPLENVFVGSKALGCHD